MLKTLKLFFDNDLSTDCFLKKKEKIISQDNGVKIKSNF